jgi:hypothetical protein
MICADHLEAVSARGTNGCEMICRIDQVSRRLRVEIPCANASHDGVAVTDEQSAAFTRRVFAGMSEQVGNDGSLDVDRHESQRLMSGFLREERFTP